MKNLKMMMALSMMMTLTACDYAERREFEKERSDAGYQAAMAEYKAGRLDAAVDGLLKVVKRAPLNSSARFQLACLQQDHVKDYPAAYCNYSEYLLQEPSSDKAKLAVERLALCEKDMAKALAKKYGIVSSAAIAEEYQRLESEFKRVSEINNANQKELSELRRNMANLTAENERLKKHIKSFGEEEKEREIVKLDKNALMNEFDDGLNDNREEVKSEIEELREEEAEERPDLSEDITAIREDDAGASEEAPPIKVETPVATPKVAKSKDEDTAGIFGKSSRAPIEKPETYVVQDGDTLYKIAIKFYGKSSAWQLIREANKATISTDGRVKVGQTIVLP